jgi:fumarate reductase flavoprotein subunit
MENGAAKGIVADIGGVETAISAQAVIMCTGGFMGNPEWLKKYFPYYEPETFGGLIVPYRGEGIEMVRRAGGAMSDECTLVREACNTYGKNKDITPSVRQPYCMWVNREGRRFIGEDAAAHSQMASNAIIRQPGSVAWCVYDDALVDEAVNKGFLLPHAPGCEAPTNLRDIFEKEAELGGGAVIKAKSLPELAEAIGCDEKALIKTFDDYNGFFAHGYDKEFAKERRFLRVLSKPPYYAVKFGVLTVETIGPVIVNENMEVLDAHNKAIPGLYCAGVMTSGWMGEDYCGDYLFGANLSYSLCSGRFAGESAATYSNG